MTRFLLLFFFIKAHEPTSAHAGILRHQILDTDSAESFQSLRTCYGFMATDTNFQCVPLSYQPNEKGAISLDAHVKANERAYTVVNRVLSNDIDREYLVKLFEDDNFQDASGSLLIKAVYGRTRIEYQPAHTMGAFKLLNPALPELHLSALNQNVIRLSHYFLWAPIQPKAFGSLVFGPALTRYKRQFAFISTDALSAAGQNPKDIIMKETTAGYDLELSAGYLSGFWAVPSVYVRIENTLSKETCGTCTERIIDIESIFTQQSRAIILWSLDHYVGQSFVGAQLPFQGIFSQLNELDASASFMFKVSRLGAFVGMSAMMQSFGFVFDSANYKIGIQYSDEKQDNEINLKRIKHTYVSGSYKL